MNVALACIAKDEDNYIDEWVNYHLKIGIDDIFIYQDDWKCSIKCDNVHLLQSVSADNMTDRQDLTYNLFKNDYNYYDFGIILDVDEFICLRKTKNIKQFLSEYINIPSICLHWRMFGDNGLKSVIDNNYSVINRFTKCSKFLSEEVKSIYNFNYLKSVLQDEFYQNILGVHKFLSDNYIKYQFSVNKIDNITGDWELDKNERVRQDDLGPINIAYINHYASKTISEYKIKYDRNNGYWDLNHKKKFSNYIDSFSEKFPRWMNDISDYTLYNIMNEVV